MKIYLAGCEMLPCLIACAAAGTVNTVLASYYSFYNPKKGTYKIRTGIEFDYTKFVDIVNGLKLGTILDSGLFSLLFGAGKDLDINDKTLEAYAETYLQFVEESKHPGYIVECDGQMILGVEKIWEFRKQFFEKWKGNEVIYVWHVTDGEKNLDKMVERYNYIAVSVPECRIVAKTMKVSLRALVTKALDRIYSKRDDIKVHLLGNTQPRLMEFIRVESCDSTSWAYPAWYKQPGYYSYDGFDLKKNDICTQQEVEKYLGETGCLDRWQKYVERFGIETKRSREFMIKAIMNARVYGLLNQNLEKHYG